MSASSPPVVGIIGGGQLGRMLALEAPRLSLSVRCLDKAGAASPCGFLSKAGAVAGGLKEAAALRELAEGCDVVTMEIEHVSVPALEELERAGVNVQPSAGTIRIIQDKLLQKNHFQASGVALGEYRDCPDVASVEEAARDFGLPLMLKSRKEGYDGRGNAVLREEADAGRLFGELAASSAGSGV